MGYAAPLLKDLKAQPPYSTRFSSVPMVPTHSQPLSCSHPHTPTHPLSWGRGGGDVSLWQEPMNGHFI